MQASVSKALKKMQMVVIYCIARGDKNALKRNYFKGPYTPLDSVKPGSLLVCISTGQGFSVGREQATRVVCTVRGPALFQHQTSWFNLQMEFWYTQDCE